MSAPGVGGRRRHHRYRHKVGSPGNLWALPKSANRALHDTVGEEKFDQLLKWMQDSDGERVWARKRWSITEDEVERFIKVDRLLNDKETIDEAMEIFASLVDERTTRLLNETLERFPLVKRFAAGEDAPASDPTVSRADYRDALDLKVGDREMRGWEKKDAKKRLKERVKDLTASITTALGERAVAVTNWTYNGSNDRAASHVLVTLTGGRGVELMFPWTQETGTVVAVKAYPDLGRRSGKGLYPDFAGIPIGPSWSSTDTDIVSRFITAVDRLETAHPAPLVSSESPRTGIAPA